MSQTVQDEAMWDSSIVPMEDETVGPPNSPTSHIGAVSRRSFLLESIRIENFKSYKGVFELGPFPQQGNPLVCVVGPNGSGKSNLMDAVAFCFSCADSKKLRGDGVASNLISSYSNAHNCSVSITLADQSDSSHTMEFTRIVNTRNESKYLLNNKKVSLEDYRVSMTDCGLDIKGNFLVFQGDVEAMALCDPSSLGKMVDRVSGSAELAKTYSDLSTQKSNIEKEYAGLTLRKRKLVSERKLMKTEIGEIEKIDALLKRKSDLINEFFLNKLFLIDQQKEEEGEKTSPQDHRPIEDIVRDIQANEELIEKAKAVRAKADMKQSKLARQLVVAETDLTSKQSKQDGIKVRLETANRRLAVIQSKLESRRKTRNSIKEKLVLLDTRRKDETKRLEQEQEKLDRINSTGVVDIDAIRDKDLVIPTLSQLGYTNINDLPSVLYRVRSLEVPLQTGPLMDELAQLETERSRTQLSLEVVRKRKAEMGEQLVKDEAAERIVEEKLKELSQSLESKSKELKKLRKDMSQSKTSRLIARKEKLESERKLLIDDLCDMKQSEAEINKERQLRDTLIELTGRFGKDSVIGRFVDIVRPVEDRLAVAVQTAAGKYIDSVFVKDVSVARDVVNWLKKEHKGTMTLIPVSDVRSSVRSVPIECVPALDCVKIGDGYSDDLKQSIRKGAEFILGDVGVCDSIAAARSVAYKPGSEGLTIVTQNGEKINSNGTITLGGSTDRFLSKFGIRQVNEITSKLDLIEKELNLVTSDLKKEQMETDRLSSSIRAKELEIASDQARIDQLKNEFKRLSEAVSNIAQFISETQTEIDKVVEDLKRIDELTALKRDEIKSMVIKIVKDILVKDLKLKVPSELDSFLVAVGGSVNDPTVSAKAQLEEAKKSQRQVVAHTESVLDAIRSETKCLELELEELGDMQELEKEEASVTKSLVVTEKEMNQWGMECEKQVNMINDVKAQIQQARSDKTSKETEIKSIIATIQVLRSEETNVKTQLIKIQKACERVKNEKVQVLKDSVMKNAYIPLRLDEEDLAMGSPNQVSRKIIESVFVSLSSIVPFQTQNSMEEDSMESLIDEVLRKIDFSTVNSDIKRRATSAARKGRTALVMADLEREFDNIFRDIESQIEAAGTNVSRVTRSGVDAKTALERLETELSEISISAERVKKEMTESGDKLCDLRERRNRLFIDCYSFVSKKVDELYKVLTSYDTALGTGGQGSYALATASTAAASLDLECPVGPGTDLRTNEVFNSGVVFSLMPPFKRYTNIELLSGGERTVAAVALLFSFLSFSAPPFSMVDEIDAALDAENVNVLSRFMKHAVPHQLLVISLKENLYAKADCLVGVYKDAHTQGSGLVTVDLRPYSDEDMSTQGEDELALRTAMRTDKKGLDGPQMTPAPVSCMREGRVLMGGA